MRSLGPEVLQHPQPGALFGVIITHEGSARLPYYEDVHPGFEIVLMLTGSQERHWENCVIALAPGDVALVNAWEPHRWRPTAPNTTALVIQCMPGFIGNVHFDGVHWLNLFATEPPLRPGTVGEDLRRRLLALGHEISGSASSRTIRSAAGAVAEAVDFIGESPDERPPAWETTVRLWATQILLLLYQRWEHRQEAARRPQVSSSHLAQILPALRLGTSDDGEAIRVSVEEAADACGLSITQFRSIFRRTIGVSFGRFELRRRLIEAARLLLTTGESVQEIAEHCGFTDRSHLHRMFVQRYAKTPAGFREDGGTEVLSHML